MTKEEAIKALSEIGFSDPEIAHSAADDIVEKYLLDNGAAEIAQAYQALVERCDWWACA